jgi:hypothetical protein
MISSFDRRFFNNMLQQHEASQLEWQKRKDDAVSEVELSMVTVNLQGAV